VKKGEVDRLESLITGLSVLLILIGILYISNTLERLGIYLTMVPYCALILMLVLTLAFLIYPARKGKRKNRVPWYDLLLIGMSLCGGGYIAFFPHVWGALLEGGTTTWLEQSLCFMFLIAIIEATRRTVNLSMALVATFFVIHLLFGSHFPGILRTFDFSIDRIASIFFLRAEGIFGEAVMTAATIILAFMIFSAVLQNSDAGRFVLDLAFSLTGRWRGGPAKAAIVGSAALGTMVGATSANVATTGAITIPLMKKTGYSPDFAGAVECVASNGGQIMPPVMGAVAFLIAEILDIPYWQVCVSAFVPALLYFLAIFVQVHYESVRLGLRGMAADQLPAFWKVIKKGWFFLIPVFVLIYLLAALHMPVEHCGLYAALVAVVLVIVNWQRRKESRKSFTEILKWCIQCLDTAARSLVVPAVACASAGIIIGSLGASGFGFRLSSVLVDTAGGNLFILLSLTAVASFILGMGMTSIPCYLILVILVAPALSQLGVVLIAAHLFVFYWGLVSFITPPVAIAAYVACGISGGRPMETAFIAVRLGLVKYVVPFLFVYNPSLLLIGSVEDIIVAVGTAAIGVFFLSVGVEGFFLRGLRIFERAVFIVGGFMLFVPVLKHWELTVAGAAITSAALIWHIKSVRANWSSKVGSQSQKEKERKYTENVAEFREGS
jgi:TRAP transporter 4TM/12TM fusion protein